jgi:putative hydrolase of the HAD superfamily
MIFCVDGDKMKQYKVIIFDLFDTIVNFNRYRLPAADIDGVKVNSTSMEVYKVFQKFHKGVDFKDFYVAFIESFTEFEKNKRKDYKEYHNRERFELMISMMNTQTNSLPEKLLVDEMVLVHMGSIANAVELPKENRDTLNTLRRKYKLAVISNFDHAPTAYGILERFDLRNLFERIFISIEVGWRKPKADIFLSAFNFLEIGPEEAIFVGDNFEADVVGSKSVGMDVVWINRYKESIREGISRPDYTVSKFAEIGDIL